MDFEDAFFDTSDFTLSNKSLGKGAFGEVFIAERIEDKKKFAAKIIFSKGLMNGPDQHKFLMEAQILHKMNHPAIVKFHGINFHSFRDANKFEPIILTEYLENQSLQHIFDKVKSGQVNPKWNATTKYICFIGIAHAMHYLHSNRIIHRDLKPLNVLLDEKFYPYVCDFGISRCFSKEIANAIQMEMTGCVGTPYYMAPELFNPDAVYGASVDVYAYGMTLYQMISGKIPWLGFSFTQIMNKVQGSLRPKFNPNVKISEKMKALIERCWSQNPFDRPSFAEIFLLLSNDFEHSSEKVNEEEVNNYIKMLKETNEVQIGDDLEKIALSSFLFDTKKLKVGEKIGSGILGTFYKATLPGDNNKSTEYTLKVLHKMNDQQSQREFLESIEIQSSLKHVAILQHIGFSMPLGEDSQFSTVTEYAPNGSLRKLLEQVKAGQKPPKWETTKALIIVGITAAMAYAHQCNIVIADIRTDSIFIDSKNRPKIGGFANAIKLKKGTSSYNKSVLKGVPSFMAPELFKNQNLPFNHKIDVYAYALVLYSIFTLKYPFPEAEHSLSIKFVNDVINGERPKFDENEIPKVFADLIKSCWDGDSEIRPSFLNIMQRFIIDKDKFFNMSLIDEKEFDDYMHEITKDLDYW